MLSVGEVAVAQHTINVRQTILTVSEKEFTAEVLNAVETKDEQIYGKALALHAEGKAAIEATGSVKTKSGQRAKVEAVQELVYGVEYEYHAELKRFVAKTFETRLVGTTLEVEAVLNADKSTISTSFALEHHFAPPEFVPAEGTTDKKTAISFPKFYVEKITSGVDFRSGQVRLVGSVKPELGQKSDKIQLIFLKVWLDK